MRVGIYIRVSSLSQKDNESLNLQKNKGIRFCEFNGFDYEIFEDIESGTKKGSERKGMRELEDEVYNKNIDGIWVYDWDRLMREMGVGILLRDFIIESKIKLWVNGDEKDLNSDVGSLEFGIGNVFADFWRRKLVRVMNNGKIEKWKRGEGFSGRVGLGYKKKEGKIIIDKEGSKIVKDVFKTFLRKDVKSYSEVLRRIQNTYGKVKGLGSMSRVRELLSDEKYLGIYKLIDNSGNVYEFNFGRIIEDDVFEEVKVKREYIKGLRKGNSVENYLLKGKIKCEDCDERMWLRGGGSKKDGKIYRYYYCNNGYRIERLRKNLGEFQDIENCESIKKGNNKISRDKLEKIVWDGLFIVLNNSEKIKNEYKSRYRKDLGLKEDNVGKIKYYEKKLEEWENKKVNRIDLLMDDVISKEEWNDWKSEKYEVEVKEIKKKIKGLKNEVKKYESVDDIDEYVDLMKEDLLRRYRNERFEFRRKMIEKYVDCVYIRRKEDNLGKVFDVRLRLKFDDESIEEKRLDIKEKNVNIYISKNKDVQIEFLMYKKVIEIDIILEIELIWNDKIDFNEVEIVV